MVTRFQSVLCFTAAVFVWQLDGFPLMATPCNFECHNHHWVCRGCDSVGDESDDCEYWLSYQAFVGYPNKLAEGNQPQLMTVWPFYRTTTLFRAAECKCSCGSGGSYTSEQCDSGVADMRLGEHAWYKCWDPSS